MLAFIDVNKKLYKILLYTASLLFIAFISYLDFISGELSLSLLYLIPIAVISWFLGRWEGASCALISSLFEFFANFITLPHPPRGFEIWNFLIRLIFYLIVSFVIFRNRELLKAVHDAARRDFLTGIHNMRSFYDLAERELDRSRRNKSPLSIAFIDLDDFKSVNDTHGHLEGDRILKIVAQAISSNIRAVDAAARIGGDEFAILFPGGFRQTQSAVKRLRGKMDEAMPKENVSVTMTIGVVTFRTPPETADVLVAKADSAMREAKKSGKNNVLHITLY